MSKVQAERAAWEAAGRLGVDLVTILPGRAEVLQGSGCRHTPQGRMETARHCLLTYLTGLGMLMQRIAIMPLYCPAEFIMGPLISTRIDGTSMGYMKVGCPAGVMPVVVAAVSLLPCMGAAAGHVSALSPVLLLP